MTGHPRLPRPPRDVDPEGFYLSYLQKLATVLHAELPSLTWSLESTWHIRTAPDGEAAFTVVLEQGRHILSTAGGSPTALIVVHCDDRAWRTGARGLWPRVLRLFEREDGALLARALAGWRSLSERFDPTRLRALPGRVHIDYTDDAGDVASYRVEIAGGSGPVVRIGIDDRELWTLLSQGGKLTQWLQSRVQISGDAGYLLRIASLTGDPPTPTSR